MTSGAGSRGPSPELNELLRSLPSVEVLAARLDDLPSRVEAVEAARGAIDAARETLRGVTRETGAAPGALPPDAPSVDSLEADARARYAAASRPALRRVLNATGVIVHTNLGRAPLAHSALEAAARVGLGYSNLEYDLSAGERGSRHAHVSSLLSRLTGADDAIAVNNCAAAVLLSAAALAGGREVVVSRGQLVEIGGSFRIPDVVAQSGARLVEVGTTNRTRVSDYTSAFGDGTGAVMRAHQSNFRTVGFVEEVSIEELCSAASAAGVPVIDDVGSGALATGVPELADEPAVRRSVAAGAAVVCFSGDKLLGGPQAGLMVGRREAIDACRRHPLARALRIDKLSLAALEATLQLYRDPARALREVPVLRMLVADSAELARLASLMCSGLVDEGVDARVIRAPARVGGGTLPLLELEGPVCAVDPASVGDGMSVDELAARLRSGDPPLVGRTRDGWLLLDPRTLQAPGAEAAVGAVLAVAR